MKKSSKTTSRALTTDADQNGEGMTTLGAKTLDKGTGMLKPNSLKTKLAYGSGDIYGGGAFMVFSLLYMNFLVLVEGLTPIAATAIIFVGKIWDAVTDPLVGRLSDKTRSKFGRRRLYFLIGIVPVMLSFIMLFYSFGISGMAGKIVYHAFAYMFFGTAFTIVMVPYNAILSDMTSDYNERTSFTTVRMIMSGAASVVCAILPGILIKVVGGDTIGGAQKNGYLVMAVILGAVFALAWLFTFLGTREKKDLPPVEKVTIKDWLSVFKNKPYLNFLGIFLFFQVAVDLVLAIVIFYVDIVVLRYKDYELIVGALLIGQIIFMAINGILAKKKGKVFPLFIGLPIWIMTSLLFIMVDSTTPLIVVILFSVLISIGASAGNLATWSMLTDIYDLDEIVTGKRREGVYSGITTFLRKFASGFAILILGFGLDAIGFDQDNYNLLKGSAAGDFNPADYAQEGVVAGIKWMFIIIPAVLLVGCLIFAFFNKINKRRFDAVLKGVDSFKTAGDLSLLQESEINDIEVATGLSRDKLWQSGVVAIMSAESESDAHTSDSGDITESDDATVSDDVTIVDDKTDSVIDDKESD